MKSKRLLILLCAIWTVELTPDCHRVCFCIVWKNLIECSAQNLSRLPKGIPADYAHMNLKNNNISSLLSGDFEKAALLHLKSLDMSFCNIHTIENGAFHGMDHLMDLNLNNNYIEILHNNMFRGALSLAQISLASNIIHTIQLNVFSGILALKMLNLKNNSISKMKQETFKGLTGLTGLSLKGNKILEVPDTIFMDLKNLTFLDISYNNISTMSKVSLMGLDNLIVLYLVNNSFHCDCELKNVFLWMTEHNVSIIASCSSPNEAYNQHWQTMLYVGCKDTGLQVNTTVPLDISPSQQVDTSVLVYFLTICIILTVILAVIIGLYRHVITCLLSPNVVTTYISHRYTSTQTIESES